MKVTIIVIDSSYWCTFYYLNSIFVSYSWDVFVLMFVVWKCFDKYWLMLSHHVRSLCYWCLMYVSLVWGLIAFEVGGLGMLWWVFFLSSLPVSRLLVVSCLFMLYMVCVQLWLIGILLCLRLVECDCMYWVKINCFMGV